MKTFIKKRKKLIFIIAVIAVILIFVMFMPRTTTVKSAVTEDAKKGDISISVSASGNITAQTSYNIIPRYSAKVIAVYVKSGDKVTKGQALIKLDDTDLQNAIKTAMYSFNAAVYKRDQLKAAPVQDKYSIDQAQQQVNSTYIQVQTAKNNVNNANIVAPIDGEILALNLKVDEYSSIAQAAVVVANTSKLEATLSINEIDINKIQVNQDVDLTIDAAGGHKPGKVVSIDNSGLNAAGIITYSVKVSIDDQTNLKPNMSVDSDIKVQSKKDVILVPAAAISEKSGKSYVQVVNNSGATNEEIVQKEVSVGLNNNTLAEITSGINVGDKVVINIVNKNSSASGFFNFGGSSK
jgi:RND family efflux transporter MFP subunit